MLTEDEKYFFQRGHNSKSHAPNSATNSEYHNSTGFETLLGMLFLKNKHDRLEEVAEAAFNVIIKDLIEVQ